MSIQRLKAKLRFGYPTGGHFSTEDEARIEVQDVESRLFVAEIRFRLADLGALLATRGADCTIEVNHNERLGRRQEVRTVSVPYPKHTRGPEALAELGAAIAPYCIDGWEADEDLGTRMRQDRIGLWEIVLRRWVGVQS